MPTTREKIVALTEAVKQTPIDDAAPEARGFIEAMQIMAGLGVDPFAALVPASDAEADVMIDKLLCLGLELRGDDLPPFDPARYGEREE